MTLAVASARIGRQLPEAELSLDQALLASTRLMETMLLARQTEGVAAYTGQAALLRLAKTQRTLLASQTDMLKIHRELFDLNRELRASGDEDGNCPDNTGLLDDSLLRDAA
ncbi:hypothetical protein [Novosphingobium sp. 9]|uniref:hypothetical protein n=1 Tax=Novosphingobium sp. 9 TaxID=2025349 RepID=UPI0021B663FB|nr:hypothetical protein [Novosphingobium sp. 9]